MGKIFFRFRGYFMLPYGIGLLILGKPSAASFMAGLLVAVAGEAIRVWGVGYAGKTTRGSELEAPLLVTAGPYSLVRHPLYAGNSLMGIGGLIMASGRAPLPLILLFAFAFLLFYGSVYGSLIPLEENFLEEKFGEAYAQYKKSVNRIIPGLRPYPSPSGTFRWRVAAGSELHTFIPFALVALLMGLKIH